MYPTGARNNFDARARGLPVRGKNWRYVNDESPLVMREKNGITPRRKTSRQPSRVVKQ